MRQNSRSIAEFGRHLRRFNMKLRKCAKNKSAALDIVPDTLFVGEFWKGVIKSKYIWSSLILLCVKKAKRVERRAHVRTNLISSLCVRECNENGEAYGYIQPFGQRRSLSYGNADKMGELHQCYTLSDGKDNNYCFEQPIASS